MKSIAPKSFESLPELQEPAGYILVLRDIDTDTFRIDSALNPKCAVQATLTEGKRRFGIELVSILETEDVAASASDLYERHHARLGNVWLTLDGYQIEELRRSLLQIDAHESLYLAPNLVSQGSPPTPKPEEVRRQRLVSRYERLARAYVQGAGEAEEFRRAYADRSSTYRRYGRSSLRRYRERGLEARRNEFNEPFSQLFEASRRSEEFFKTIQGKILKFVLVMLFVAFITLLKGSG